MLRVSRFTLVLLAATALPLLASCSKKAQETPPPAQTESVRITAVELGTAVGGDKRITQKTEVFRPNDMIYATVLTSGAAPTATLKAKWTFEDGQVVEESEQAIAPTGDAATEFHISKPDGWPAGKYRLEVFLDGALLESRDFEVKAG